MSTGLELARERLLFAQAVYEYGNSDWARVCDLLKRHPLLQNSETSSVTEEACADLYLQLMQECQFDVSTEAFGPHAAIHLELARKFYRAYTESLRAKLEEDEARFRDVATEIDEIRAGLWDARIKAEIQNLSVPTESQSAPSQPTMAETSSLQVPKQDSERAPEVEMKEADIVPTSAQSEPSPITSNELQDTTHAEDTLQNHIPETIVDVEVPHDTTSVPEEMQIVEQPGSETPANDQPTSMQDDLAEQGETKPVKDEEDTIEPESQTSPQLEIPGDPPTPEEEEHQDISQNKEVTIDWEESRQGSPLSPIEPPRSETKNTDEPSPLPTPGSTHTAAEPERRSTSAVNQRKRRFSDMNATSTDQLRESKRLREESEPIDIEEDPRDDRRGNTVVYRARRGRPTKNFKSVINLLHAQISQHRNGNIFHNPIKKSEAPDYYDIVKRPMDLKTIKARIKDNVITNSTEFQGDIYLMFMNAMMYNRPRSDIFKMAEEMLRDSEINIQSFRQTEGWRNA